MMTPQMLTQCHRATKRRSCSAFGPFSTLNRHRAAQHRRRGYCGPTTTLRTDDNHSATSSYAHYQRPGRREILEHRRLVLVGMPPPTRAHGPQVAVKHGTNAIASEREARHRDLRRMCRNSHLTTHLHSVTEQCNLALGSY